MTKSPLTDDDDVLVVDEHGAGDMSTSKHAALTVAIVVSGFAIAYFVNDLQMGEPLHTAMIRRGLIRPRNSPLLRWFHRIDDGFVYFTWPVLLETDEERPGDGKVVESVRTGSRDIRNASVRVLVRDSRSDSSL